MLLSALIFYLKHEAPEDEQNFSMVCEMLRYGRPKVDDDEYESPLDILFRKLELKNPSHIAVKYYKDYHSGGGRTLQSIQVTLASRIEKFNLEEIAGMTMTDEMELDKIRRRKNGSICNNTRYSYIF